MVFFSVQSCEYIKDKGLCSSSEYPYEEKDDQCWPWACSSRFKITGYRQVRPYSEQDLQDAVARIGPVAVYINFAESLKYFYERNDIFYDIDSHGRPTPENRLLAVLVVGYGTTMGSDF